MRFNDKTICKAINCSWNVALNTPADNISDSVRRWVDVSNELYGMFTLLHWASCSAEDRKAFEEIRQDILFLRRLAEFNAFGC